MLGPGDRDDDVALLAARFEGIAPERCRVLVPGPEGADRRAGPPAGPPGAGPLGPGRADGRGGAAGQRGGHQRRAVRRAADHPAAAAHRRAALRGRATTSRSYRGCARPGRPTRAGAGCIWSTGWRGAGARPGCPRARSSGSSSRCREAHGREAYGPGPPGAGPYGSGPRAEVGHDHVAEHPAVVGAALRVQGVAAEEGAEGVLVGHLEDAYELIIMWTSTASVSVSFRKTPCSRPRARIPEIRSITGVPALPASRTLTRCSARWMFSIDTSRMKSACAVWWSKVSSASRRMASAGSRSVTSRPVRPRGCRVGALQDLDVELLLAAEVVVDHPLGGAGASAISSTRAPA